MSIPLRLAALSAFLIAALIATNVLVIRELNDSSGRITGATGLFEQLEAANGANGAFGNIRYWLTDLAVSLLTISERNAKEARDQLGTYLERLAAQDPQLRRISSARPTPTWRRRSRPSTPTPTTTGSSATRCWPRRASTAARSRSASRADGQFHAQAWAARDAALASSSQAIRTLTLIVGAVVLIGIA